MAPKYPYNPKKFVIEIHTSKDVFHREFPCELTACRCVERLIPLLRDDAMREIRMWHEGSLISKFEARQ